MTEGPVIAALVAEYRGDAELMALLGDEPKAITRGYAAREHRVPSIEWFLIASPLRENTGPVLLQLDFYASSFAAMVALKERAYALTHSDLPRLFGGLLMWTRYRDSRERPDTDSGDLHHQMDFLFEPARRV